MGKTKLMAAPGGAGATTSFIELDLKEDVPISINKAIADIREPDKRTGSFSKTITLPGSKTNNKFFEYAFEVNISSVNWNSNLKAPAYILADGIEVHRGHLQLSNVTKEGEKIEYSVIIYGANSNIFTTISDSKIEDLDFSAYNHAYTRTVQKNTWSATKGTNVFYPIIDYGYKQLSNDHYYHVEHLRPGLYLREYLNKIFTAAGKTWTSTFLDSTFFKSLYIPHNGQSFNMSASTLATYEFYAGRLSTSAVQTIFLISGTFWKNPVNDFSNSNVTDNKPDDDTTSPFNDAGGIYDPALGKYTANKNGYVNMKGSCKFELKLNMPGGATTATGGYSVTLALMKSTNGGSTWTYQGGYYYQTPFGNVQLTSSYQTATVDWEFPNIAVASSNAFKVVYSINCALDTNHLYYYDAGNNPVTTGISTMNLRQLAGSYFIVTQSSKTFLQGDTVTVNDAIPKNIKQRDLLMWTVKMFKLCFDVDKANVNNYIIEPRDDYQGSGTTRDWTYKLAVDRPLEVKPMGELKYKTYIYKYKEDKDFRNTMYQETYKETYGQRNKIITNDFLKDTYTTEIGFSPTPVEDNVQTKLIVPKIFSLSATNQVSPLAHNIRLLINGGLISGSWLHRENSGSSYIDVPETTYPYSGMTDHPFSNTVSIEFGIPGKIYYYDPSYLYTDNNLFNKYHYREYSEVTDRDSKIVVGYFDLSPIDINTFDFRDKIFIKDAYYYVNNIIDYDPIKRGLTKVELLKLKGYAAYVPNTWPADEIETNSDMG